MPRRGRAFQTPLCTGVAGRPFAAPYVRADGCHPSYHTTSPRRSSISHILLHLLFIRTLTITYLSFFLSLFLALTHKMPSLSRNPEREASISATVQDVTGHTIHVSQVWYLVTSVQYDRGFVMNLRWCTSVRVDLVGLCRSEVLTRLDIDSLHNSLTRYTCL